MTSPDIVAIATPLAVIIAAVVERMSANRIKHQLADIHQLVNSRLTQALDEIAALKAAAIAAERLDTKALLDNIEKLLRNVRINPRNEESNFERE